VLCYFFEVDVCRWVGVCYEFDGKVGDDWVDFGCMYGYLDCYVEYDCCRCVLG